MKEAASQKLVFPKLSITTNDGKYLFTPQDDISAIELSCIFAITMNCNLQRDMKEYFKMPENKPLLRHFSFEKIEPKTVNRSIKHLRGTLEGKPIAVLGGGPSLMDDIKKLPKECIKISVNHHAIKAGIDCAIMVFMDDPKKLSTKNPEQLKYINEFKGIKISQIEDWSDFDLYGVQFWDGGFSSSLATWLSCYMGCTPVILCGMDCYRGPDVYCHEYIKSDAIERQRNYPLKNHIGAWKPALLNCPNSERICAISGPLVISGTFPKYKGGELGY